MRRRSLAWAVLAACHAPAAATHDAGSDAPPDAQALGMVTATVGSTRFVTREHMLAAGEMQISGEPLATTMGRLLSGYSRDLLPTDIYLEPSGLYWIDLAGFSTAVESYEYSKQPMNGLSFELGAGTSLIFAPVINGSGMTGSAAVAQLDTEVMHLAGASNAAGQWVFASEPLGWPGFWPTAHVFDSFDPTIAPTSSAALKCVISSDDTPADLGDTLIVSDFECDATTLHLVNHAAQIDPTITVGGDAYAGWKSTLWVMNYLEQMHDSTGAQVASVPADQLASVGVPGNTVVGADATGAPTAPGTYLGSSPIEGFQAGVMLAELDNRAADWLWHFATNDAVTLAGLPSTAAALAYNYASPLAWFPSVSVSEAADASGFPLPSYTLASPDSELLDLTGMLLAYANAFALTDARNPDVGGAQSAAVYFDGDPFPDNVVADGENTLHDRALAMLRVAFIDLDRMHVDPASGVLVDHVAMAGAQPARGATVATSSLAYAILGLRATLRALGGQLELYSNNTPDTAVGTSPLDGFALALAGNPTTTFSQRVDSVLQAQAALLLDQLTDATGRAWSGWNVSTQAPVDDSDTLDAHTAAMRGLFAAFLATGDVRYRDRALAVFARVQAVFYDPVARMYEPTPAPIDDVEYTPLRFALLQSALRDMYELVASRPGGESLEMVLEDRLGRLNTLVLNGWDDRNADKQVQWPDECVNVVDGLPRGGLEMAERALSGELGRLRDEGGGDGGPPTSDREHDCVPSIDSTGLPAALADSVTFHVTRP